MAREFDGVNQRLTNANAVSPGPLSMACWFYPHRNTHVEHLIVVHVAASGYGFYLQLLGTFAGDPVAAVTYNNTAPPAQSTSGYSVGSWQHGCAVIASGNDRRVYLNGGSKGTNNTTMQSPAVDSTSLADTVNTSFPFDGAIAEAAIWGAALTDAEAAILAQGFSPLFVQPDNLLAYWPLLGNTSPEIDLVGGYNLTLSASAPTKADHPRVRYPG